MSFAHCILVVNNNNITMFLVRQTINIKNLCLLYCSYDDFTAIIP